MFGCRFCALHPCPLMGASPASSCAPPRPPVFCPPKPHSSLYFWGPLSRCLLTIPTPIGARTSCRSLPSCVIDGISVPACVEPVCSSLSHDATPNPGRSSGPCRRGSFPPAGVGEWSDRHNAPLGRYRRQAVNVCACTDLAQGGITRK